MTGRTSQENKICKMQDMQDGQRGDVLIDLARASYLESHPPTTGDSHHKVG